MRLSKRPPMTKRNDGRLNWRPLDSFLMTRRTIPRLAPRRARAVFWRPDRRRRREGPLPAIRSIRAVPLPRWLATRTPAGWVAAAWVEWAASGACDGSKNGNMSRRGSSRCPPGSHGHAGIRGKCTRHRYSVRPGDNRRWSSIRGRHIHDFQCRSKPDRHSILERYRNRRW